LSARLDINTLEAENKRLVAKPIFHHINTKKTRITSRTKALFSIKLISSTKWLLGHPEMSQVVYKYNLIYFLSTNNFLNGYIGWPVVDLS